MEKYRFYRTQQNTIILTMHFSNMNEVHIRQKILFITSENQHIDNK